MNTKVRNVTLGLLAPIIISVLIKLIRIFLEIYIFHNWTYNKFLFVIEIIIKTLIILGLYKFVKLDKYFSRYLIFGLIGILLADLYILIK